VEKFHCQNISKAILFCKKEPKNFPVFDETADLSDRFGDTMRNALPRPYLNAGAAANGISPYPTFPNIAGQKEGYIAYALRQYQTHQRLGAQANIMTGVATQLNADDIKALAAYYASLSAQ
jgi:hypothetical protein